MPAAFACPPDCGYCCTHLERAPIPGDDDFRALLREQGIYSCTDATRVGLALSNAEADALRAEADARGMVLKLHPRTFLLETKRRVVVVLDWHMPYKACPFYADFRCTAYAARPLVCRAYPVLTLGRGALAPECPKVEGGIPTVALKAERAARRAIESAHAAMDEAGWAALATPGARFAMGLSAREAAERARRYRLVTPEEFRSRARATSSTS